MQTIQETFAAGETKRFYVPGQYFRILTNTNPVDVSFLRSGRKTGENASQVDAGYYAQPDGGFEAVEIYSATAQTVKIAIAMGTGGYDRTIGSVSILNTGGVFAGSAPAVTNADTQILAANLNRRYLLIQNQDAAGNVWVKFGGAANAGAGSVKIPPGGYLELQNYVSTDAVHAIGDIASNANVTAVEG